jgi:GntR family transcriptional regulator of vanillate catabolism
VRAALVRLEDEGFLEPLSSGGYAVKSFTKRDIFDAIEIRGAMEGLAARFAAERCASAADFGPIKAVLAELDDLLAGAKPDEGDFVRYVGLNARFHTALKEVAGSPTLARQIDRASAYPFASASGFVAAQRVLPEATTMLTIAQHQHHSVVEAMETGEGARAEALMREHAVLAIRNLKLALHNKQALELLPGAALIQTSA